jgi:hypothetical protein
VDLSTLGIRRIAGGSALIESWPSFTILNEPYGNGINALIPASFVLVAALNPHPCR